MKTAMHLLKQNWSALLLVALLMVSCAKEPLDAPADCAMAGTTKGLPTMVNMDDTSNGATNGSDRNMDDGDTISDDGDDVGDGERNKKKKSN